MDKNNIQYLLLQVGDREIYVPEVYETWDEAVAEMLRQFKEFLDISELKKEHFDESSGDSTFISLEKGTAYGERHGMQWDWRIFDINLSR